MYSTKGQIYLFDYLRRRRRLYSPKLCWMDGWLEGSVSSGSISMEWRAACSKRATETHDSHPEWNSFEIRPRMACHGTMRCWYYDLLAKCVWHCGSTFSQYVVVPFSNRLRFCFPNLTGHPENVLWPVNKQWAYGRKRGWNYPKERNPRLLWFIGERGVNCSKGIQMRIANILRLLWKRNKENHKRTIKRFRIPKGDFFSITEWLAACGRA